MTDLQVHVNLFKSNLKVKRKSKNKMTIVDKDKNKVTDWWFHSCTFLSLSLYQAKLLKKNNK